MAHPNQEPLAVPQDHPDDEKTIHAEREYSEKKDLEAGRKQSFTGSGADSVKLQEANQAAESVLEDECPDGGLKAWSVVLGVRPPPPFPPSRRSRCYSHH